MAQFMKNPAVLAGIRRTTSGSYNRASQLLAGKRKANELARSSYYMEPAKWCPAPRSVALTANSKLTGEQAVAGSRHPGPFGGRGNVRGYFGRARRSVLSKCDAQTHSLGYAPTNSHVSIETTNRSGSNNMVGPLRGTLDCTTIKA